MHNDMLVLAANCKYRYKSMHVLYVYQNIKYIQNLSTLDRRYVICSTLSVKGTNILEVSHKSSSLFIATTTNNTSSSCHASRIQEDNVIVNDILIIRILVVKRLFLLLQLVLNSKK